MADVYPCRIIIYTPSGETCQDFTIGIPLPAPVAPADLSQVSDGEMFDELRRRLAQVSTPDEEYPI